MGALDPARGARHTGAMPFVDTNELRVLVPKPGWNGRFFHSEHMTFAYYDLDAGASLHTHFHENEEVWHVVDGELEVTLDGTAHTAGPGCAAVVPANVEHAVRAITDCRVIVVDYPLRTRVGDVDTR
jgi:quercetin dioxygenase-like cupin family protein